MRGFGQGYPAQQRHVGLGRFAKKIPHRREEVERAGRHQHVASTSGSSRAPNSSSSESVVVARTARRRAPGTGSAPDPPDELPDSAPVPGMPSRPASGCARPPGPPAVSQDGAGSRCRRRRRPSIRHRNLVGRSDHKLHALIEPVHRDAALRDLDQVGRNIDCGDSCASTGEHQYSRRRRSRNRPPSSRRHRQGGDRRIRENRMCPEGERYRPQLL